MSKAANQPNSLRSLPEAIRLRVNQFSAATCIEIDGKAQHTACVADLFDRASIIENELAQLGEPGQHDVVLCLESALDLVPAAWACIFADYNMLPVHFHSSGLRNRDLPARLEMLAGK